MQILPQYRLIAVSYQRGTGESVRTRDVLGAITHGYFRQLSGVVFGNGHDYCTLQLNMDQSGTTCA